VPDSLDMFPKSQLGSATATASVSIALPVIGHNIGYNGIAFDSSGKLWVGLDGALLRYPPGSTTPDVTDQYPVFGTTAQIAFVRTSGELAAASCRAGYDTGTHASPPNSGDAQPDACRRRAVLGRLGAAEAARRVPVSGSHGSARANPAGYTPPDVLARER
jgi:hypothetical protein